MRCAPSEATNKTRQTSFDRVLMKKTLLVMVALFAGVMLLILAGCGGDGASSTSGSGEEQEGFSVRSTKAQIFQRARTSAMRIRPVEADIVWFDSPVERARQMVRMVLDGIESDDTVVPARGISYREVFVDDAKTAWIDLEASNLNGIRGSDGEAALVACLARTLVENIDEIERVGILVEGQPRRALSGHLDLTRTFTGREWDTISWFRSSPLLPGRAAADVRPA